MAGWKQKAFKLAQDNGMVIEHEKSNCIHVADVCLVDKNMRFAEFDDETSLVLRGVDGYYNRPDWEQAHEFVSLLVEEGFYRNE